MKINNINNASILKLQSGGKDENKSAKSAAPDNLDSVNISKEAKELAKQQHAEKIATIKERISSDYYSRKDVLEATAKAILKELE